MSIALCGVGMAGYVKAVAQYLSVCYTLPMIIRKTTREIFLVMITALYTIVFAQERIQNDEITGSKSSPSWSFSASVDAAYYPKSETDPSSAAHFAPISGIYKGIEGRIVGHAVYTIPIPFGEGALFRGNNISIDNSLELSPISIKPEVCVTFTPIACFNIGVGGEFGTAWNIMGFDGIQQYDKSKRDYDDLTPFASWYYQAYAQAMFGADTGFLFPGEWTHVIAGFIYKVKYEGMLNGGEGKHLWCYQESDNRVDGWQYHAAAAVMYQMPLILRYVGVLAEFKGHYMASDYPDWARAFNGDFMLVEITPMARLKFSESDSLTVMAGFKGRRSYKEKWKHSREEPFLTYQSREWIFNRIALSYKHDF